MKLLRLVDPGESIIAAETALRQVTERIETLEADRAAAIASEDFLSKVAAIDREIETAKANAKIHQDRIASMRQRQHQALQTRREQEKKTAIAEIEKKLKRRLVAAQELDGALKVASEAVATLLAADDELFAEWPPDVLPSAARLAYLRASILEPLSPRRTARPNAPGLGRQLLERLPFNFADDLQKMGDELLAELQSAPITDAPSVVEAGPRPVDVIGSLAAASNLN